MTASVPLYIPSVLTHLYGSPIHAQLTAEQQIRYNHLCGLMAAEQFLAFEEAVIIQALHQLMHIAKLKSDTKLMSDIQNMIAEEGIHAKWFTTLLTTVEPQLYAQGKVYFTALKWWERFLLKPLTNSRDGALIMLWFVLLIEEHSVHISQAMIADNTEPLDQRFVAVHRRHLIDELRHLPIGIHIIERVFDSLPKWRRYLLAAIFRRVLRNIARPRRANAAVIRRLVDEFPALQTIKKQLLQTVRTTFRDHAPQSDVTHPEFHPLTINALSSRPEFAGVVADMHMGWKEVPLSLKQRLFILLLLEFVVTIAYLSVGALAHYLHPHPPSVPLTVIDKLLPNFPFMIIFYNTLGLFILLAAWFRHDRFKKVLFAGIYSTIIAYAFFLVLPFEMTRGPIPLHEPWKTLTTYLYAIDTSYNTIPSLHVAYVTLIILGSKQLTLRWIIILWGLLIIASTALINQHALIDIISGSLVAVFCWFWVNFSSKSSTLNN